MSNVNVDDGARTDWAGLLRQSDIEGLWNGLLRLVTRHPATRPLRFATDETTVSSTPEINADLAQELFLELFQKGRFDHYMANGYTSVEIANELTHIELPNFVGSKLRKRYPESFRMARRVSSLLKTGTAFRKFGKQNVEAADDDLDAAEDLASDEISAAAEARPRESRRRSGKNVKAPSNRRASKAAVHSKIAVQMMLAGFHSSKVRTKDSTAPSSPVQAGGAEVAAEEVTEIWEDESDFDRELVHATSGGPEHPAPAPKRRMVDQIYGLKNWTRAKAPRDGGHFSELAKSVPVRRRDTRIVGRHGASQLIISTEALEELMVEIFNAIDSPADVRTIRQLTLSKIPLQDYSIASLDDEFGRVASGSGALTWSPNGTNNRRPFRTALAVDCRLSPEQELLAKEHAEFVKSLAYEFLVTLSRRVNGNRRRYQRLVDTLWHCYFDENSPSQIEIARLMGVSDSLVSSNRRLIESELKGLSLLRDDGPVFSEELRHLVASRRSSARPGASTTVIPFPLAAARAAAASACAI